MDSIQIEKIDPVSKKEFKERYLKSLKPVVIKNLYDQFDLSCFSSRKSLKENFSNVDAELWPEYFNLIEEKDIISYKVEKNKSTVGGYLDLVEKDPNTKLMVNELITPKEFLKKLPAPPYSADYLSSIVSKTFIGNKGNYAHLHFDGDYKHVLFHQVYGKRKIVLIPPTKTHLLGAVKNFSSLFLNRMSEEELDDFLRFVDGRKVILNPGETIYMPPAYWHYLEYLEDGMAINFRFGNNPITEYIRKNFHMGTSFQRIAYSLVDYDKAVKNYSWVIERLKKLNMRKFDSAREKYNEVERECSCIIKSLNDGLENKKVILEHKYLKALDVDYQIENNGLYSNYKK